MIPVTNLKLFPVGTREISIPNRPPQLTHTIFFYPENTNLIETYSKLNIKRMYLRKVLLVGSRYPKFIPTQKYGQLFREIGLFPIRKSDEKTDNIIIDVSFFLDMLESRFGPGRYRRTIVSKPIKQFLESNRTSQLSRKTILFYVVDLDKPFSSSIYDRRIWPILDEMMQTENMPFDYFLFCFLRQSEPKYTLFKRPDKTLPVIRIRNILLNLKSEAAGFEDQEKSDQAADEIVSKVEVKPSPPTPSTSPPIEELPNTTSQNSGIPRETEQLDLDNEILDVSGSQEPDPFEKGALDEKTAIKGALSDFLKAVPRLRNKLLGDKKKQLSPETYYQLATAAILYSVSGNLSRAIELTKDVPDDKKKYMFDRVKDELLKDIIPVEKARNNSRNEIISKVNLDKISENKNPQHLLAKRRFDFSTTFERDLIRCFELLADKKDFPLRLKDIKKTELPVDPGDLDPSIYNQFDIILVDERGRHHPVQIQVPRLLEDGTFIINGKKKYISYQIVLDPIFFIKPGQAKLETLYAPIAIHQKKTKKKEYFDILIGGYRLPLIALLVHYLGFDKTCQLFSIRYQMTPDPLSTAKKSFQLEKGFINFFYDTNYAEILIASLYEIPITFNEQTILIKQTFTSAIIKITGNRNCIFKIDEVLSNIMEPVATQVLKTKLLPFILPQIILYICKELVTGRVDDRNDITKQRIRSSELFVHQIEKLVLGSYNEYRTRRVSGDKDAEYRLDVTQAVKHVVNSVAVKDLEDINPTEELSCMTRVIPIGEGGIPDSRAITLKSRGVHPTYYGNIDAMDTPEGSIFFYEQIYINKNKTAQLKDINVGDKILWKDEKLYNIIYKHQHKKIKYEIRTKCGNIVCSKDHRFPVYDIIDQKEKVLKTEEILKDTKRYKFIKVENDQTSETDIPK